MSGRRQECRSCGVHTTRDQCGNCGSFDLRPVDQPPGAHGDSHPLQALLDALYPPRAGGDEPRRLRGL